MQGNQSRDQAGLPGDRLVALTGVAAVEPEVVRFQIHLEDRAC